MYFSPPYTPGSQPPVESGDNEAEQSVRGPHAVEGEPGGWESTPAGADQSTDVTEWRTPLADAREQRPDLQRAETIHVCRRNISS